MALRLRSIRVRLTLWYIAILAVILVLFSGAVYFTMRSALWEQLDDSIQNRSFLVQELITVDAAGEPELELTTNPELDDVFVRLFSAGGEVSFDSSAVFGDVPVDEDALAAARSGRSHRATADAELAQTRILTAPVIRDGAVVGVLQVGQATDDLRETLRKLLIIIALAAPAALVLAAAGGWWLASRALAPIDRVTMAARDISAGADLERRLDMDLPDDEVGRLARTFDEMLARLQAAFERQKQFTSDASHELRTPLTAVRGQVDVALQQERSGEEYRRVLREVNVQVDRMTRLSETLLMLARSDAGATSLDRERIDAGRLIRSVRDQVQSAAEAKGLEVVVEAGAEATIEGDEGLLLQMLLNLADNAVKYTERGSVTLGWRAAGDGVEMLVRDTGPGIAEEHQPRVFERFYRGDASRSGEAGGLGLGLAIARSIAETHGGGVTLESGPDGTTFTFKLP